MFIERTDAEAETPILWPPHAKSWLIGKDSDAGRDWRQEEKGTTEDEMAGWHHRLDGCESEWTPGVGDGQGGLLCCGSWGRKESDTTELLNWLTAPEITLILDKGLLVSYSFAKLTKESWVWGLFTSCSHALVIWARSQHEELCPWQRSWGRRLRHSQRRDQASGSTPFSRASTSKTRVCPLYCFMLSPTPLTLWGLSPITSLREGVNLQLQLIKIPGRDRSVSTNELLWRLSSLPVQVRPATCDCLQPPNHERHKMF